MKHAVQKLAILSLVILASGCANRYAESYKPCTISPEEKGKYATQPEKIAEGTYNPSDLKKARDEHVNGCASVTYQIDSNGTTKNIKVLKEVPTGYGFGEQLIKTIKNTKYKPPVKPNQVYYAGTGWTHP